MGIESYTGPDRPTLESLGITPAIAEALEGAGLLIVPHLPTPEMLHAARWEALAEDQGGVWREMVAAWRALQNGKF